MEEEFIIKVLALLIAAFLGFAKLIKYDPQKEWKEDLLKDLEILSKLDKENKHYNTVNTHITISLMGIYYKDHKPWYSLSNRKNKIIVGIPLLLLIFSFGLYLT